MLKEMEEIERVSIGADTANPGAYDQLIQDLTTAARSPNVHIATSARVVLAGIPIIREYEQKLRCRSGASDFAVGMIDGMANLVANMIRVNPKDLDAEFKSRFERVVRGNLAHVGRKW
ncbi:MAG: hypothetical protein IT537_08675 [Hyphomicrobiales bacterium]|nr:hypothetical protein [Hyphomicrobiales bacterium]